MSKLTKHPVNWFEIYTNDIERAKKFYSLVLQTKFHDYNDENSKMALFDCPDYSENQVIANAAGALVQMEQIKAGGNSILVYFECEDCQVEQGRVEAAGGKVLTPKFSIGENGFCAWCMDTEGNTFGLHSMK